MSIDRRAERGEEARQARCVENHCEIHAPLNPEWPLSKMCAGGGGPGEEGNLWGQLSLSLSPSLFLPRSLCPLGITQQTPDTLCENRDGGWGSLE